MVDLSLFIYYNVGKKGSDAMSVIRTQRDKKGWTLAQLGDKVGVAKGTIFRYETYQRKPSFAMCDKLARVFKISPRTIFNDYLPKEEK